jgi:hypothetical protein
MMIEDIRLQAVARFVYISEKLTTQFRGKLTTYLAGERTQQML